MLLANTTTDAQLTDLDLVRFIPMMTSRIIISLKKVASSGRIHMSGEALSGPSMNLQDTHSHHPLDNIQLSPFKSRGD